MQKQLTLKRKLSSSAESPASLRTNVPFELPTASLSCHPGYDPYSIGNAQTQGDFTTQALVASEDAVYTAVFGSLDPSKNNINRHPIAVSLLGTSPPIPVPFLQSGALNVCRSVPFNYKSIRNVSSQLLETVEVPVGLTRDALLWSIIGAASLLHPESLVCVTKLDLGTTQLGIKANRSISRGTTIPELYGTMANDCDDKRTRLSEIFRHPTQTGPEGVRLLAGPLRLANHHCRWNCEWVAVRGSAGYFAVAKRDIQKGEPITFDYGSEYFEDLRRCPCPAHEELSGPSIDYRVAFLLGKSIPLDNLDSALKSLDAMGIFNMALLSLVLMWTQKEVEMMAKSALPDVRPLLINSLKVRRSEVDKILEDGSRRQVEEKVNERYLNMAQKNWPSANQTGLLLPDGAEAIYEALGCRNKDNGKNIVLHFHKLHSTAPPERPNLLPIEVQGLYRIENRLQRLRRQKDREDRAQAAKTTQTLD